LPDLSTYSAGSMSANSGATVNAVSSRSGIYRDPPHQGNKQEQNKTNSFDPALLARLADEERRKKMGGGSSTPRFKSPSLFVLYSLKLMAEKMMELYKSFEKALQSNSLPVLNPQATEPFSKLASDIMKSLSSNKSIENFLLNLKPSSLLFNFKLALKNTMKTFLDIFQMIFSASNAFANKLYKNKYNKDQESQEDDIKSEEEHPLLIAMKNMFGLNR
jgi:hypothetical protein